MPERLIKLEEKLNRNHPENKAVIHNNKLHITALNKSNITVDITKNKNLSIEYGTHLFMCCDTVSNVDNAMEIVKPLLDGTHTLINL